MLQRFMGVVLLFLAGSVYAQAGTATRQTGLPSLPSACAPGTACSSVVRTGTITDWPAAQLTDTAFAVVCTAAGPFISTLEIGGQSVEGKGSCEAQGATTYSGTVSTALSMAADAVMASDCFSLPNDACLRLPFSFTVKQLKPSTSVLAVTSRSDGWVNFDSFVPAINRPGLEAYWGVSGAENVVCTKPSPDMKPLMFLLGRLGPEVVLSLDEGTKLSGRIRRLTNLGELCVSILRPQDAAKSPSNPEPAHALNSACQNGCGYSLRAWDTSNVLRLGVSGTLMPAAVGVDPLVDWITYGSVAISPVRHGVWPVSTKGLTVLLALLPVLLVLLGVRVPAIRTAVSQHPSQALVNAITKVWPKGDDSPGSWRFSSSYSLARVSILMWTLLTLELLIAQFLLSGGISLTVATTTAVLMGIQLINVTLSSPTEDAHSRKWLDEFEAWETKGAIDEATAKLLKRRAQHLWAHSSLMGDFLYKSPVADDQIVFSRLQMIVFSIGIYVWIVVEFCASGAVPPLSNELLALTGVSSGAYMGFKLSQSG